MKPEIILHADYKRELRARLNTYFPDKSSIPKEIFPLYHKFRDLNLSAVDQIMQSHYSNVGPKPWPPSVMLRALLVMIAYKCTTIARWITQLRVSPILAIICGFDPNQTPGVGTLYDFMSRLWDLSTDNYSSNIKQPQKNKLKKPKAKGQKAESVESESVAELIVRLTHMFFQIDDEAYATLYNIFRTCFLDHSIDLGLVNPEKLCMAGDGTPVVTAARFRSHHICDCREHGIYNCSCDRFFPQPDCNVGWDSSREAWYFGYDMYVLTDSDHDLPLFAILHQASKHDSHGFCEAFFRHSAFSPDLKPFQLLLDSAHDNMATYELCQKKHIQPFIDLNLGNTKKGIDYHGVILGPDGIPVCSAGLKMKSNGNDLKRQYAKFICPKMSKGTCSCDSPCSTAKRGRTCSVPLKTNIRLYTSPPRESKEWQNVYNGRTASERCKKRMKLDYLLEDAHHHSTKFWYIRIFLIMMLLHLDAWPTFIET